MDAAHAPHDAHIAIGIPAIQLPLVIQVDAKLNGLLRAVGPLKDLQPLPFMSAGMLREQTGECCQQTVEQVALLSVMARRGPLSSQHMNSL